VTIDTIAPGAPSVPDLIAASDSGSSSTDNITNITTPTFTGTAEANATVKIYDAGVEKGSALASGTTYNVQATTPLSTGVRSITAKAMDAAGNLSAASSALSITIDTTAPAAPSVPDLVAASDSGTSSTEKKQKQYHQ